MGQGRMAALCRAVFAGILPGHGCDSRVIAETFVLAGLRVQVTVFTPEEQATLAIHPKPLCEFASHLLLSQAVAGNARRMQLFDQGIRQLRARGRYQEIMAACASKKP